MRSTLHAATAATCLASALLVGAAVLPQPSLAQTTPPAAKAVTPAAARPAGETMQAMVEQRIKQLHTSLHITAAEQPQWDQFTQAMRDNAKATDALYEARQDKLATMTAVENMQSYAAITQQHAQDMQKLVPAFQTLYASFSDQQKKQADQVFRNTAEKAQQARAAKQ